MNINADNSCVSESSVRTVFRNGVFTSPSTSSIMSKTSSLDTPPIYLDSPSNMTSSDNCTVVQSSSGKVLAGRKCIQVHTLTQHTITLAIETKCKLADVFTTVLGHLGVEDSRIFGLASKVDNNEYRFHLDMNTKLSKITQTHKSSQNNGRSDSPAGVVLHLHLRILLYVDHISLIRCSTSLLHYYHQLREQARILWTDNDTICEDQVWEMAALALQADFGDYSNCRNIPNYFRPESYFPLWVINQRGLDYVSRHMPGIHMDLAGIDRHEARKKFCRDASRPPHSLNMHLFWLRKSKSTPDNILMAVASKGLHLFEVNRETGEKRHLNAYSWGNIAKLGFERRKFTLVSVGEGRKMIFYSSSDDKSRYILSFCRKVHQFNMALQPEVQLAVENELREGHRFRESYIYSDHNDLEMVQKYGQWPNNGFISQPCSPTMCESNGNVNGYTGYNNGYSTLPLSYGGQRVSVVSDASSNTTSGIVSDRQQPHDDSELDTNEDVDSGSGMNSSPLGVSQMSLTQPRLDLGSPTQATNHILMQKFSRLEKRENEHSYMNRWESRSFGSKSNCSLSENHQPSMSDKTMTGESEVDTASAVHRNIEDELETLSHEERLRDLQARAPDTIFVGVDSLLSGSSSSLRSKTSQATSTYNPVIHSRENSRGSARKVNIDELRQKTLLSFAKNGQGVDMADSCTQTNVDSLNASVSISATSGKLVKTLSTQTTGYYSCYKAKEEEKKGRLRKDHKAYRIVNAHKSFNENDVIDMSAIASHSSRIAIGHMHVNAATTSRFPHEDVSVQCGGGAMSYEHVVEAPPAYPMLRKRDRTPQTSPGRPNSRLAITSDGEWYNGGDSAIYEHLVHWQSAQRQSHSMHNLHSMPLKSPPGYNQAVIHKQEQLQEQQKTQRRKKKRWTTVSGVDEQLLERATLLSEQQPTMQPLYPIEYSHRIPLQQATSEPGIDQSIASMQSQPGYSGWSMRCPPPYPTNRSVSSTQISSICMSQPINSHEKSTAQMIEPSRVNLSRVQSMPGYSNLAKATPQLRSPPTYIDAVSPPKTQHSCKKMSTSSAKSGGSEKYCKSCQRQHTGGTVKMNIGQIKAMLRNHNLPMLTALCNETANEQSVENNTVRDECNTRTGAPLSPAVNGTSRPVSWHDNPDIYVHSQVYDVPETKNLDTNSNLVVHDYCPVSVSPRFSSTPNLSDVQVLAPPPPYGCHLNNYNDAVQRNTQSSLRNAIW